MRRKAQAGPTERNDEVDGVAHINERRRQAIAHNKRGAVNQNSESKKPKVEDRFKKKTQTRNKFDDFDRDFENDESLERRPDDRSTRKPRHQRQENMEE